jgi:hypothetical protein
MESARLTKMLHVQSTSRAMVKSIVPTFYRRKSSVIENFIFSLKQAKAAHISKPGLHRSFLMTDLSSPL